MLCPKCSTELSTDSAKTCFKCGAMLGRPTWQESDQDSKEPSWQLSENVGIRSWLNATSIRVHATIVASAYGGVFYLLVRAVYKGWQSSMQGSALALIGGGILNYLLIWPGIAVLEIPALRATVLRGTTEGSQQQDVLFQSAAGITASIVFLVTWAVIAIQRRWPRSKQA
jgi:hypothetical protein